MDKKAFNREKRRLHILYKRLKVGLEKPENISNKDKGLLAKYYGVSFLDGD